MTAGQDIRFAFRMMLMRPSFSLVAITALALGIGVNTTVFTLVNAVLLRGLPFEDSHRIMHLENKKPSENRNSIEVSYPDFADWREQAHSFIDIAAFDSGTMNLADDGGLPERYRGAWLTANAFRLLGQPPLLGRDFHEEESLEGAEPVAILGYRLWQDRYGGDENVLGRTVRINSRPTVVIGVMPEGVRFPVNEDLWLAYRPEEATRKRDRRSLEIFARLKPDVVQQQAQAEMDGIAARLAEAYPETNEGMGVVIKPYNDEFNGGPIRLVFLALLGAVGFVLLIACSNVANLLLARSAERAKEISVRLAMGASRWRVIRQLLCESLLLSMAGGLLGLAIAAIGVRLFEQAVADVGKPYWIVFNLDLTVFSYFFAICVATGVVFGLAPALHASRTDINEVLKEGGRGGGGGRSARRLAGVLVVGELALAIVLLVGAGLMIRSFLNLYSIDLGIDQRQLLVMRLGLPEYKYQETEERFLFHQRLADEIEARPGLVRASIASNVPLGGSFGFGLALEGQTVDDVEQLPSARTVIVGEGYFESMGLEILQGRAFNAEDGMEGREAAVISQRFAQRHWPGENPLGKRLKLYDDDDPAWTTVVGLTRDIRHNDPSEAEIDPLIYIPYRQYPLRFVWLVANAQVDPHTLVDGFRRAVRTVDPDLPVYDVMTLAERSVRQMWPYRVFGSLFTIFALIALVLASLGVYGLMAYSVSRRTQEIGIRMAMGAQRSQVQKLILRQGLVRLALGLVVGLLGAIGLSRVLSGLLVQVSPNDPLTFLIIALLISVASLLACLLPARRASRVDPLTALRTDG